MTSDAYQPFNIPAGSVFSVPPEARAREEYALAQLVVATGGPVYLFVNYDFNAVQAAANIGNGVFDLVAIKGIIPERILAAPAGKITVYNDGDSAAIGYLRFHDIQVPIQGGNLPPEFAVSAERRLDREVNTVGPPRSMQPSYGLREDLKNT